MGIEKSELKGKTRWDLVALIRELSADKEEYEHYSRANASKRRLYRESVARLFREHLTFLEGRSTAESAAEELERFFQKNQRNFEGEALSEEETVESAIKEILKQSEVSARERGSVKDDVNGKKIVGQKGDEKVTFEGKDDESSKINDEIEKNCGKESAEIAYERDANGEVVGKRKRYRKVAKKRVVLTILKPIPGHKSVFYIFQLVNGTFFRKIFLKLDFFVFH